MTKSGHLLRRRARFWIGVCLSWKSLSFLICHTPSWSFLLVKVLVLMYSWLASSLSQKRLPQWIFLCNCSSLPPANGNFPYCLLLTVTFIQHMCSWRPGIIFIWSMEILWCSSQPPIPRSPSYYSKAGWREWMSSWSAYAKAWVIKELFGTTNWTLSNFPTLHFPGIELFGYPLADFARDFI